MRQNKFKRTKFKNNEQQVRYLRKTTGAAVSRVYQIFDDITVVEIGNREPIPVEKHEINVPPHKSEPVKVGKIYWEEE